MELKTLKEFENKLKEAMNSQDIKKFKDLVGYCPFLSFCWGDSSHFCPDCPLSDRNGPTELLGSAYTCLRGSMSNIYHNYCLGEINEGTALVELVLQSIKLLAYLESKE